MNEMKIGFEMRKIPVLVENILPLRQAKEPQKQVQRYRAIVASIKEVGLVEPLVVYPQRQVPGKYLLLDGHLRLLALRELGQASADCIISKDDECFTYNARVNRIPAIQEHKMITKAVRSGAKPERIAAALNVPVRVVKASMRLLDGIHEEAVDVLKDKYISAKAVRLLKRVTGIRQIEIVELMVSANNFSTSYAEALVLGTQKDQLMKANEPKKKKGLSSEEIARMEQEMESLERDLKGIEETYGENMLVLTVARGYIKKLLENSKIARFLNGNCAEICSEFEAISAAESL